MFQILLLIEALSACEHVDYSNIRIQYCSGHIVDVVKVDVWFYLHTLVRTIIFATRQTRLKDKNRYFHLFKSLFLQPATV